MNCYDKMCFTILFVFSVFYAEIKAQTTWQTCSCVALNTCYQNISITSRTDGRGIIDVRIVNGGSTVTVPPVTTTTIVPTITCATGTEVCCTPDLGCGVRYNIPLTPTTTPRPGQGRYGSQPWQAVILGSDNSFLGAGVLIDNVNVLTAAHKLINKTEANIKISLGVWNDKNRVETYPVENFTVSKITRHPNFTSNNLFNDVALIRLSSPVQIGSNPAINTACLPGTTNFDNYRCLVSGWGKDAFSGTLQTVVKEVDVPIVSNNVCQDNLRKTRLGSNFVLNTASFICAGGETGKDACVGDGGSPLVCNFGGKYQVVGLVAWGIGCGNASTPGVYVRVQNFLAWIKTNTA